MRIEDLYGWLTEGLPADQAAIVKGAIERDAVKNKVATLKMEQEYNTLTTQIGALTAELDGAPDRPGTRAYAKWYNEHYKTVEALDKFKREYEAKFGAWDPSKVPTTVPTTSTGMSKEEIQALIDKSTDDRIGAKYAPMWDTLLTSTGTLVQKHMLAGRKAAIDFKAVAKLAQEKFAGNLEMAYDEWDKPERDKETKAAEDARVEVRVKEELAKRGATTAFPPAADFTPGGLTPRPKVETDKFDRTAMQNDLARTFQAGEYPKAS